MKKLLIMIIAVALAACASITSTTDTKGVRFGMSYQSVLDRIRSTETVLESNEARIVSEGPMSSISGTYRKTYEFAGGRLSCVQYEVNRRGVGTVRNCE